MEIVDAIVPHFMNNNEEPEAVDLLMEVEALQNLTSFTTAANFDRVARYLLSLANYAADPQEMGKAFKTTYEIYMKHEKYTDAMKVAQKINSMDLIKEVMTKCQDRGTLK